MQYLLDTCVISDFTKGELGTQTRLKQTPPADIAVSESLSFNSCDGIASRLERIDEILWCIAKVGCNRSSEPLARKGS